MTEPRLEAKSLLRREIIMTEPRLEAKALDIIVKHNLTNEEVNILARYAKREEYRPYLEAIAEDMFRRSATPTESQISEMLDEFEYEYDELIGGMDDMLHDMLYNSVANVI